VPLSSTLAVHVRFTRVAAGAVANSPVGCVGGVVSAAPEVVTSSSGSNPGVPSLEE
jgi:hypothetical protein